MALWLTLTNSGTPPFYGPLSDAPGVCSRPDADTEMQGACGAARAAVHAFNTAWTDGHLQADKPPSQTNSSERPPSSYQHVCGSGADAADPAPGRLRADGYGQYVAVCPYIISLGHWNLNGNAVAATLAVIVATDHGDARVLHIRAAVPRSTAVKLTLANGVVDDVHRPILGDVLDAWWTDSAGGRDADPGPWMQHMARGLAEGGVANQNVGSAGARLGLGAVCPDLLSTPPEDGAIGSASADSRHVSAAFREDEERRCRARAAAIDAVQRLLDRERTVEMR